MRRAIQEEEGLDIGTLCRVEPGDRGETADNGLNKRRNFGEGGDGEEVEEVVPVLLALQDADREAGVTA